jgi:hypothetical protein
MIELYETTLQKPHDKVMAFLGTITDKNGNEFVGQRKLALPLGYTKGQLPFGKCLHYCTDKMGRPLLAYGRNPMRFRNSSGQLVSFTWRLVEQSVGREFYDGMVCVNVIPIFMHHQLSQTQRPGALFNFDARV